jgi:hypothetical protein
MPCAGHRLATGARVRAAHFVRHHFPLQRIAVNAELLCRGALIALIVL